MALILRYVFLVILFHYCSPNLNAQVDRTYINLSEAHKNPDKVYHLDLTLNKLKKSEIKKLREFSNLETLELPFCQLKHFPRSILECKNLKYLNLEYNSISSIPDEIVQLSKLEELKIGNNEFEAFPSSIFKLKNLRRLDILNTKPSFCLPKELVSTTSIESLRCSVSLSEFKEIIWKMPWLKELEILTNEFISPCLLDSLKHLEQFYMILGYEADFELFECSLTEMSQLKEFTIMHYTCCWPYIELDADVILQIKSQLPKDCALGGFRDKNEKLKSDIELR